MKKYLLFFFILFSLSVFAQEEVELSVHLKNGDILTGKSDLRLIPFKTDFGTLNLPIDQINSIEIGLKDSRFDKGNLLSLLNKVDNGSTNEKNNAFDEVLKMDEGAIPFIKAYLNSSPSIPNENNDITVQTLYEVMLAKYNVSRNYSLYDVLTYNYEFKVEGSYDFSQLTIDTDYGIIKIDRNDIARIDVKLVNKELKNKNSFKLFANQHISGNKEEGWLNTGILVKKGEKITITASGQIVLASLSGNTYTPDGGVNGSLGPQDNKTNYGQIVFKISSSGTALKAGDSYTGYATQTGIIYLAIYESMYNSANAGYYNVNVKAN
ncbi:MAG: hypothetical protein LRY27_03040 [Chitinophagales bacterium]|nr:hypothetical protein [Chitinophagales bacterium]